MTCMRLSSAPSSSARAWIVLHLILGDEPLFHVPAYQLVHPLEFGLYAVLGLFGGLLSVAFVKLLLWQRKYFLRMPATTQWLQPAAGGCPTRLSDGGIGGASPPLGRVALPESARAGPIFPAFAIRHARGCCCGLSRSARDQPDDADAEAGLGEAELRLRGTH